MLEIDRLFVHEFGAIDSRTLTAIVTRQKSTYLFSKTRSRCEGALSPASFIRLDHRLSDTLFNRDNDSDTL